MNFQEVKISSEGIVRFTDCLYFIGMGLSLMILFLSLFQVRRQVGIIEQVPTRYVFVLLTNKENSTKTKIEQEQRFDAVRDCPNYNQAAPLLPGTYYNGQILLFPKRRYCCCILLCNNSIEHSVPKNGKKQWNFKQVFDCKLDQLQD